MTADLTRVGTVCFDVGEVLIDETHVWSVWANLFGVSPFTLHAAIGAALAAGRSHEDALARIDPTWRELLDEAQERNAFREDDLYADARPTLTQLRAAGFTVAVCGNQPARRTQELRALGLDADLIATSAELGAQKPSSEFYVRLLARLGDPDPASVLYVGDRLDNDVVPAAAHGLVTAWLRRGPWALLQPRPEGAAPDVEVTSLSDLGDQLTAARR